MHRSSLINMQNFKDRYLKEQENLKILDVGSQDICGSYKGIFKEHGYVGFDIFPGKNVDITNWEEIDNNSFDVVISGQAFEHIENDQAVIDEIARVLKVGSFCCIIAPSIGPKHCEHDYRRYQPKDFVVLAEFVGLKVIEVRLDISGVSEWNDCILIAQKV